jgi:hypothetical protein
MAQAQILGGTYQAGTLLWNTVDTVYTGSVRGVGGRSLEGKVASVQIVSEEQKKSFVKSTATGLAGAAIAGPVGAVAGIVAGGNSKQVTFSCQLHQGGQFVAKGDSRIFELLLAESMKPRVEPVKTSASAPLLSGDFPSSASLVLSQGKIQVRQSSSVPLVLNGKVRSVEALSGPTQPHEMRFRCELRDGRRFEVQGDPVLYESLRSKGIEKLPSLTASIFWLSLILLAFLIFGGLLIWAFLSTGSPA